MALIDYFGDFLIRKSASCCGGPKTKRNYRPVRTVTFQLPFEEYEALEQLSRKHGASVDEAVRYGLQPFLKELCNPEPEPEERSSLPEEAVTGIEHKWAEDNHLTDSPKNVNFPLE